MNESIFREYDIRGIVETDLQDEVVIKLGRAYGSWMARRGHRRVVIGHDLRLSSPHLTGLFIDGVRSTGLEVTGIGQVTTPILYFAIIHYQTDGGVMITGSHNPIEFNGFKMCEGLASIHGAEIQALKSLILRDDFENRAPGGFESKEVVPAYLEMMKSKFTFRKRLKVVIDAGNGAAGPLAPGLWRDLGLEVVELYCEPDGHFPNHLPDPTVPKFMQDLCARVRAEKADLGIGYDGDADRVGAVDDQGRLIYADALMALLARDVLAGAPGRPIIYDVKCSQLLGEQIAAAGGVPLMWKTGHSLLKAKMKEMNAPFAGEMSGHLFFADRYYGFDDGLYASGRLMQIIADAQVPFSALVNQLPSFFSTPEIRVECADAAKFRIISELAAYFSSQYETLTLDGARVQFGDGWGLVRASNTQPVLVLRFEARTRPRLQEIIGLFKRELAKYPEIKFNESDFKF